MPGEIDASFAGQMPDPEDPPDVVLAVEPDIGGRPGRTEQTLVLVDPQGSRMGADERRRHADDVDGLRRVAFRSGSCHDSNARTLTMALSRVLRD